MQITNEEKKTKRPYKKRKTQRAKKISCVVKIQKTMGN